MLAFFLPLACWIWSTRNSKADEPPALPDTPETTSDRGNVRNVHNVALVPGNLDGFSIRDVPNGMYGFTYALATNDAGLFRNRMFQSFEMHKNAKGDIYVIGSVDPKTAARIHSANELGDCFLPPAHGGCEAPLWGVPG